MHFHEHCLYKIMSKRALYCWGHHYCLIPRSNGSRFCFFLLMIELQYFLLVRTAMYFGFLGSEPASFVEEQVESAEEDGGRECFFGGILVGVQYC
jgi:hypothetical protein